jgi:hypothetical protein
MFDDKKDEQDTATAKGKSAKPTKTARAKSADKKE